MKTWIIKMLRFYREKFVEIGHSQIRQQNIENDDIYWCNNYILNHSFYNFIYDLLPSPHKKRDKKKKDKVFNLTDFCVPEEEIEKFADIKNKCSSEKHLWQNSSDLHFPKWEPQCNAILPDILDKENYKKINYELKNNVIKNEATILKIFDMNNSFLGNINIEKNNTEFKLENNRLYVVSNGKRKDFEQRESYCIYYCIPGMSGFMGHGGETPETRIIDRIMNVIDKYDTGK